MTNKSKKINEGVLDFGKKMIAKATNVDKWHELMRAKYGKQKWDAYWKENRNNSGWDKILNLGFNESNINEGIDDLIANHDPKQLVIASPPAGSYPWVWKMGDDGRPVAIMKGGLTTVDVSKLVRAGALYTRDGVKAGFEKLKSRVNESKQLTEGVLDEMDDDGFMAKRQLYDIAKYAIALHKMIQDTDNLEPWIQAKITKAEDYIDTIKHYMEYKDVRDADATADVMAPDIADIDSVGSELDAIAPEDEVMEGDPEEGSTLDGWDILRMASTRGLISKDSYNAPSDELMDVAYWFADELGPQHEIGSSDVSIWMKQFAREVKSAGLMLDGGNAHLYESEMKAENIFKNMTKDLRKK